MVCFINFGAFTMSTLAADKNRKFGITAPANIHVPCVANDIVYQGAAVGDSSGTARPLVAGDVFLGFAYAKADNTGGSASDIDVEVRPEGTVILSVTGVTSTDDVGTDVYATDDDTFTTTASGASSIGTIERWITGTTCEVFFQGATRRSI
jgi:hypothetical protein